MQEIVLATKSGGNLISVIVTCVMVPFLILVCKLPHVDLPST